MKAFRRSFDIALAVACGIAVVLLWRHFDATRAKNQVAPADSGARQESAHIEAERGSRPSPMPATAPAATVAVAGRESTPSAVSPRPVPPLATTLYDRYIEKFRALPDTEDMVKALEQAHERIMSAADDPGWARAEERQLTDFIYAQVEASRLEISSIVCRSNGCETQILGTLGDSKRGPGGRLPAWQSITRRLSDSDLSRSLRLDSMFAAALSDRTAYITTFRRLPAHEGEAAADEARGSPNP